MAKFNLVGMDSLTQGLEALGSLADDDTAEQLLKAGAAELVKSQKTEIRQENLYDTGQLYASIRAGKVKHTDGHQVEVYPQGKRRKNGKGKAVRNEEVGFVLHYGSSSIRPTHWMDTANQKAEEPKNRAMDEKLDEIFQQKIGK